MFQTEHDDYKEECSKNKQIQQENDNTLQAKINELQEELKTIKSSKDRLKVSLSV